MQSPQEVSYSSLESRGQRAETAGGQQGRAEGLFWPCVGWWEVLGTVFVRDHQCRSRERRAHLLTQVFIKFSKAQFSPFCVYITIKKKITP